jgi:glycerol kinase
MFGELAVDLGAVKVTFGTSAMIDVNTGGGLVMSPGAYPLVLWGLGDERCYGLEGTVLTAGAAVQWLRDGLEIIAHAAETDRLAREVPDTGGVYFVPAFVGLGAPHWEADARGTIVGLTRGTRRAHLVRAALEAMAFSVGEVLDAMTADAGLSLTALQVDGGAAANDWLMQFQADLVGVPVARPDLIETTALGAAGLAGLAAGIWPSGDAFLANRQFTRFAPGRDAGLVRARRSDWRRAVATALHWASQGKQA